MKKTLHELNSLNDLIHSIKEGNLSYIKSYIKRNGRYIQDNFETLLYYPLVYGKLDIFKFLAKNSDKSVIRNILSRTFNNSLLDCVKYNREQSIRYVLSYYNISKSSVLHDLLIATVTEDKLNILKYLLSYKHINPDIIVPLLIKLSARHNRLEFLKYFKITTIKDNKTLNNALDDAVGYGHINIVKLILQNPNLDLTGTFVFANSLQQNYIAIAELLVQHLTVIKSKQLELALFYSTKKDLKHISEKIIKYVDFSKSHIFDILLYAIQYNDETVVNEMFKDKFVLNKIFVAYNGNKVNVEAEIDKLKVFFNVDTEEEVVEILKMI